MLYAAAIGAQITVNVTSPGGLSAAITAAGGDAKTITNLIVTGSIDVNDIFYMRDKMPELAVLNMENVVIKSYGSYPENTIPQQAFYSKTSLTSIKLPETISAIGVRAFWGCSGITGNLVIPNAVTSIGYGAFLSCNLTSFSINNSSYSTVDGVLFNADKTILIQCPIAKTGPIIIPNTVTTISNSAFSGCVGLTGNLTIPNSVTTIGSFAFSDCKGFTGNLTIPNSVSSIKSGTFSNCKGFTGNLTIPNSVTSIENNAFCECSGFTGSLVIPNSVTSLELYAFAYCTGFKGTLTLPSSLTTIGNRVFMGCSGFSGNLTIPGSVTSIGESAFDGCKGFNGNLTIPNSVTSIGEYAFYDCSGLTGNLNIPNSVTTIGAYTFFRCSGFDGTLTIPNSVTSIDNAAFYNCGNLTGNLVLPNTLTSIGSDAFYYCKRLTGNLNIPNSVTTIGDGAFEACNLTSININNSNYSTVDGVLFNADKTILILCPAAKTGTYTIPNTVKTIHSGAFKGCKGLTGDLIIPNSVTTIENKAFSGCTGFTGSLVIPNSVTFIDFYAFAYCTGFNGSLTLPNSITTLKELVFRGSSGFTGNLTIPGSVTSIGESTFSGCNGFNGTLAIPGSVTSIGDDAFLDCSFQKINVNNTTPPTIAAKTFGGINKTTCQLTVPFGAKATYKNTNYWKDFINIFDGGMLVTFNSQGGTDVLGVSAAANTTFTAPVSPTRTGYSFAGWYKEVSCTNAWNFATDVVSADVTLYAKWNTATGVQNVAENALYVYPNPVADILTIYGEDAENISVSIFNLSGAKVWSGIVKGQRIDISQLPAGVYILKTSNNKETQTIRFVKQ